LSIDFDDRSNEISREKPKQKKMSANESFKPKPSFIPGQEEEIREFSRKRPFEAPLDNKK
jgi:hypothetical protein